MLGAVSVDNDEHAFILHNFVSVQSLCKAVLPSHSMVPHQESQTWSSDTGVQHDCPCIFKFGEFLFDLWFYLIYLHVIQWEHTECPVVCPNLQTNADKLLNAKVDLFFFSPCVHKILENGVLYARRTDFLTDVFFWACRRKTELLSYPNITFNRPKWVYVSCENLSFQK